MRIIGISGLAGSGKDTIADILCSKHHFVKIALADVMKRFVMELWGVSEECLWGPSHLRGTVLPYKTPENENLTVRKILQHFGTEGGRAIDHDVWARYAIRIAKELLTNEGLKYTPTHGLEDVDDYSYYDGVVISDCRFVNELDLIKSEDGLLIRVKRPGAGLEGQFALHRSEQEMSSIPDDYFNHIIINDGSLSDLEQKVDELVSKTS